jgi:hypothetical protein
MSKIVIRIRSALTRVQMTMTKAGWDFDYLDIDTTKENPVVEMWITRNDGLRVFARADRNGVCTIERYKRERELGESRMFGKKAPRAYVIDDVLLGRQRPEGARQMLRMVLEYVADNADGSVSLKDLKDSWAGLISSHGRLKLTGDTK